MVDQQKCDMLYSMVWSGVAWTINILAMLITDYYRICIIRFDGFRSISMFAFFALFFLFFSIVINFTHTLNLNLWIRHTDDWYFGMAMWMHRRILWKRRIEYWLEIPFFLNQNQNQIEIQPRQQQTKKSKVFFLPGSNI